MSHGPTKAQLQQELNRLSLDFRTMCESRNKLAKENQELSQYKDKYEEVTAEEREAHRTLDMIPGAPLGDRGDASIFPGSICYQRSPLTLSQRIVGLVVHMMTPKPPQSPCSDPEDIR